MRGRADEKTGRAVGWGNPGEFPQPEREITGHTEVTRCEQKASRGLYRECSRVGCKNVMNKLKVRTMRNKLLVYLAAAAIPALLIVDVVQAQRYAKLKSEVRALEQKQVELVEKNKKLISDISVLSSSDRIERIAEYELGMRKANTDDIVRVEIKGSAK